MTPVIPPTAEVRHPRYLSQVFPILIPVASRLREHLGKPLHANVYALTVNTVVSSLLGIGYWAIAAHLYTPRQLGTGAAVVSTMLFLSSLSQLNLNGAISRFLPTAGRHGGRLIRYAYGACCCAALLLGCGFLLLAPAFSAGIALLSAHPLLALAFVASVAAWGVFTLQDSVLTSLRGVVWVPVENAAFGIAKIVLLVLLVTTPNLGIFLSWNVPAIVALVPVNLLVFRRLLPRLARPAQPASGLPERSALVRFVTLDYVGFLFLQIGTNALPLLVTGLLGAGATAVFYIGWLLGSSMELVAYHFSTSLTVESARDPRQLGVYARQMLRRGLLLFGLAALLLSMSATALLTLFGSHYADASGTVLRLFAIAVVPKFVVTVFVASCRVRRRVGPIVLIQAVTSALVVLLSVLTARSLGVAGIGLAYLTAQLVVAAATLPALTRLLRSTA